MFKINFSLFAGIYIFLFLGTFAFLWLYFFLKSSGAGKDEKNVYKECAVCTYIYEVGSKKDDLLICPRCKMIATTKALNSQKR